MPRPGDGSSHNGPFDEAGHTIAHGVGSVDVRQPRRPRTPSMLTSVHQTSKVDRADKAAPLPEGLQEKGQAVEGANASGGQSQGIKKGGNVGQGAGASSR